MCRACRSGSALPLPLPPATAPSTLPNGIRNIARQRTRRRLRPQCPIRNEHFMRPTETTMTGVFARLASDFFSTILFLALYLTTSSIVLATSIAIAGAIGQVIYARVTGKELSFMTWASLALVIVLGGVTLLTQDPRFVLAKPSIAHFAIGAIMLKRDWMLRYMPPIVAETIPNYVTIAGYAWAILM